MNRLLPALLCIGLPLVDLAWNLTHLNIGLVDFYGLSLPAYGMVLHHAWPATPYFPAGYPLLLIPFGLLGSALIGGYILSALGAMLALSGARALAIELGCPPPWALAAVALAWAEGCFRVTAGSPSVDMLYTGVGVWLLWAAVRLWVRNFASHSISTVSVALTLTILGTTSLRYHSLWFFPIFLVLLVGRRVSYGFGIAALGFFLISFKLFATANPFIPPASSDSGQMALAVPLQVRIGLEADQPTLYKSTDEIFAHYADFATMARGRSVVADYGWARIATHTLKSWLLFLRRPAVVLALLFWVAALALGRAPPGATPLALWVLLYTLALSPAYYTPRAALLPVLAATALAFSLAARVCTRRGGAPAPPAGQPLGWPESVAAASSSRTAAEMPPPREHSGSRQGGSPTNRADIALTALSLLLIVSLYPAGKFARADLAQRRHFAQLSAETAATVRQMHANPDEVKVADMRIIRLPSLDNPWQRPYKFDGQTWLDDPAIRKEQVPGYRDK